MHTHTHARMHTCTHVHTHTYTHACTHAHTYTYVHIYMHTHAHIHIHIYIYTYILKIYKNANLRKEVRIAIKVRETSSLLESVRNSYVAIMHHTVTVSPNM